jgi:glycosyltransferase involved in cell wall biosynthesis
VHVDGLEWKRSKWSGIGRRYYQYAERLAVRWADRLIADAEAIRTYYAQRYGAGSTYIPYGAPIQAPREPTRLEGLDLEPGGYHLVVARMEPENNVDVIVAGYAESNAGLPLVVVGTAPHAAEYERTVRELAGDRDVRFLGSVWDQELLDELYANTALYLHGHSVGGTNPSLLRAMGAAAPAAAFDVIFNRDVLGETGEYFADPADAAALIEGAEREPGAVTARGIAARARAAENYDWDAVADQYESLCEELVHASKPRRSGLTRRYLAPNAGPRR